MPQIFKLLLETNRFIHAYLECEAKYFLSKIKEVIVHENSNLVDAIKLPFLLHNPKVTIKITSYTEMYVVTCRKLLSFSSVPSYLITIQIITDSRQGGKKQQS